MKRFLLIILLVSISTTFTFSQPLKPGFDYNEYLEMIQVMAHTQRDSSKWDKLDIEYPEGYTLEYRSEELALKNRWDLWVSKDSVVVISVRGTVGDFKSWLENFYAAMIPATGSLHLSETREFNYKLSTNPRATVHVGWTLAIAYIAPEVDKKINAYLDKGYKNFIITGHSQGGAISYLLTAHVLHKRLDNKYNSDFTLKTICSAAPKPGNIYFAYEYEYLTQNGWAYNVINAMDWIPETPFSVQTMDDLNELNPIQDKKQALKNQGFIARLFMGHAYNKVDRSLKKSVKQFEKYLGKKASKYVIKNLPEFEKPNFVETSYYVRAGNIIVLYPDEDYHKKFSKDPEHTFVHHFFEPYIYLAKKQRMEK